MALVAITREHERWYRRSKGQLQDVRTFIPKDPEMARSTESLCPSTKPWPQTEPPWGADQITCTMMNLYFCRLDTGQVQLWPLLKLSWWWTDVGRLQVRMQNLYPAPSSAHSACLQTPPPFFPLLLLCLDPEVIVRRINPGQLVDEAVSVQPPQWPTIAHCLFPLYCKDLHYLHQPSPLLTHYGYESEDICIMVTH